MQMANKIRTVKHDFLLTEEENEMLQKKMKAYGITKKSSFFRAMILKGYMLKLDLPEIREMIRLLKNLTKNVNQIARRMNEHGSIYETEIDEIKEKQQELQDMLMQLLARLNG